MSRSLRSCTAALFAAIAFTAIAGCQATPPLASSPAAAPKAQAVETATVRLSLSGKRTGQLMAMTDAAVAKYSLEADGIGFESISSDTTATDPEDLTLQVPVGNSRVLTLTALDEDDRFLGDLSAVANIQANTVNVVKINHVADVAGDLATEMLYDVEDEDSDAPQTLRDAITTDLNTADFAPALNTFVTGLFGSDNNGTSYTGSVQPTYLRYNELLGYMATDWATFAGYIRANDRAALLTEVPEIGIEGKSTVTIRIINSVSNGADVLWTGLELYDPFSGGSARLKSFAGSAAPADQTYMNVPAGFHLLRLISSTGTSSYVEILVDEAVGKTFRFDVDVDAASFPAEPLLFGVEI